MDSGLQLSKRTFWDVDITQLDLANSSEWIINRVFDRGTLDEVMAVIRFYGFEFVKQSIKETPDNLPNHAILLAMAVFQLKFNEFKCSEKRLFPSHC